MTRFQSPNLLSLGALALVLAACSDSETTAQQTEPQVEEPEVVVAEPAEELTFCGENGRSLDYDAANFAEWLTRGVDGNWNVAAEDGLLVVSPTEEGPRTLDIPVPLPAAWSQEVAGRAVTVTYQARSTSGSPELSGGYYTKEAGNSGQQVAQLGDEMETFSFAYNPPATPNDVNDHFLIRILAEPGDASRVEIGEITLTCRTLA